MSNKVKAKLLYLFGVCKQLPSNRISVKEYKNLMKSL